MGLGQYTVGVLFTVVCGGALVCGARQMRARALPGWTGSAAWVADAVIALSMAVLALEVAGVAGVFTRVGVLTACLAIALVASLLARAIRGDANPATATAQGRPRSARWTQLACAAALGLVAAPWVGWTVFSYRHGMQTVDTLWYHMPLAARFVQLGNIRHLQYFDSDPVTVFYPANSELLHAAGLLFFRSDVLSPAINLGWAALALTAAWAIGRPFQRGPHCMIAALVVLGTPGLVETQPGGAYNDVVCIALLLSAGALLVHGGIRTYPSLAAAAATGFALGVKFTMIVPALALGAIVVAVAPRHARARQAALWLVGLLAIGGYWYARNALASGNPLPSLSVHLGPLSLPAPQVSTPSFTVSEYLLRPRVWSLYLIPGLAESLGPAWWAIVILAAVGALGALMAAGERVLRALGAVAVIGALAFVFTPQFLGLPGAPIFFAYNVRYAATPIALGLVLLPVHPRLRGEGAGTRFLALELLVLLGTEIAAGVWPTGIGSRPLSAPVSGGAAIAGALAGAVLAASAILLPRMLPRARVGGSRPVHLASAGAIGVAAIAAFGFGLADRYARARYASTPPIPSIYRWAQGLGRSRIGVVGLVEQYPLAGRDSASYVQYVGLPEPHAGFGPITHCRQFRDAVNRGRYRWLLIAPAGFPLGSAGRIAPELTWLAGAAVRPVLRERPAANAPVAVLYRVNGRLDPGGCRR